MMQDHVEREADQDSEQAGYLEGANHALPYYSAFSRMHHASTALLGHVNCSYLSSGRPPTLLALKQHAQSLAVLIRMLNPAVNPVEIDCLDTKADATWRHIQSEAFDYLACLREPYENDDPAHHRPLNSLVNEVKGKHECFLTEYHCPLTDMGPARQEGQPQKPYAAHHRLLMHANECLERLDHEFSATGGLLSILPTGEELEEDDMEAAKNSLMGQWLVFTQHLVGRMHELEMAYGNALDALAGEAVVPLQHMSAHGPDGRSGREIAYPQDRFVLANAGDDVWDFIHAEIDKKEALIEPTEQLWRTGSAASERWWQLERDGVHYARGIVGISCYSRFYRLRGQGRSTLFCVPAYSVRPDLEESRRMESQPTVVSVLTPKFPLPSSEFERRYHDSLDRLSRLERANTKLVDGSMQASRVIEELRDNLAQQRRVNTVLEAALGGDNARTVRDLEELRREHATLNAHAQRETTLARDQRRELERRTAELHRVEMERDQLRRQLDAVSVPIRVASEDQPRPQG